MNGILLILMDYITEDVPCGKMGHHFVVSWFVIAILVEMSSDPI